ncbi:RNA polymerase sigma-70 factor [Pedobacter gandavensis]|uniref:RNA polymerase sigma factor n=1 Tax=Pedobacter gandavensis TaxID=2679963 RepID=UPI00292DEFFB|nr:RNA polymerase sigma-70 factor [Pedobacter gandavensis]
MNQDLELQSPIPIDLGNKEEFTSIYNLYYEPLCFFAERYVRDTNQAEDIIAGLFSRLWQQNTAFNDAEHLKAYLYRAAANACFTHAKSLENLKAREDRYAVTTDMIENTFLNNMIRADVWAEIYRAIDKLPAQCAQVIKMSFIEDLKNPEIADKLGISLQTVKNHKHRGLSILRGAITKDAFYFLLLYACLLK